MDRNGFSHDSPARFSDADVYHHIFCFVPSYRHICVRTYIHIWAFTPAIKWFQTYSRIIRLPALLQHHGTPHSEFLNVWSHPLWESLKLWIATNFSHGDSATLKPSLIKQVFVSAHQNFWGALLMISRHTNLGFIRCIDWNFWFQNVPSYHLYSLFILFGFHDT